MEDQQLTAYLAREVAGQLPQREVQDALYLVESAALAGDLNVEWYRPWMRTRVTGDTTTGVDFEILRRLRSLGYSVVYMTKGRWFWRQAYFHISWAATP